VQRCDTFVRTGRSYVLLIYLDRDWTTRVVSRGGHLWTAREREREREREKRRDDKRKVISGKNEAPEKRGANLFGRRRTGGEKREKTRKGSREEGNQTKLRIDQGLCHWKPRRDRFPAVPSPPSPGPTMFFSLPLPLLCADKILATGEVSPFKRGIHRRRGQESPRPLPLCATEGM